MKKVILKKINSKNISSDYIRWMNDWEIIKYTEQRYAKTYKKDILKYLNEINKSKENFIFGIFIILFYKNYKSIQVTDSTNVLMQNILNTRKTVRYFVYYNVGMTIAFSVAIDTYLYNNSEKLYEVMDFAKQGIPKEGFANIFIISQIIVGFVIIALLILFYWLVYGILLKKLKGNYRELKKINS